MSRTVLNREDYMSPSGAEAMQKAPLQPLNRDDFMSLLYRLCLALPDKPAG